MHRRLSLVIVLAVGVWMPITALAATPRWYPIGPYGADLVVVAADPREANRVYAAARRDVYVSVDGGAHFAALPAPVPASPPIGCCERVASLGVLRGATEPIVFPPAPPQLIVSMWGKGVFYSADGGRGFGEGQFAENTAVIWFVFAAPGSRDVAYLSGVGAYVSRTTDGGATWRQVATPYFSGNPDIAVLDATGDTLLLAGDEGIFRSTNAGLTWAPVAGGLPAPPYAFVPHPAQDSAHPGVAFIAIAQSGTYRSNDAGANWVRVGPSPLDYEDGVALLARDGVLWFNDGGFLSRSLDGGQSWAIVFHGDAITMALDAASARVYAGRAPLNGTPNTDSGVWTSDDQGTTWRPSLAGLTSADMDFAVVDSAGAIYAKGGEKLYARADGEQAWRDITPPVPGPYPFGVAPYPPDDVLVLGAGSLLVRGADSQLYRSGDGGANWQRVGSSALSLIAAEPGQPNVLYGRDYVYGCGLARCIVQTHIEKSVDGGLNWQSIDAGLPLLTYRLFASGGSRLLASTSDGYWLSPDGGMQWTRTVWQTQAGPSSSVNVRSLAQDPTDLGTVHAVTDQGLFRSDDAGANFALIGALPTPDTFFVAIAADAAHTVYVATTQITPQDVYFPAAWDAQVYSSTDGGVTWSAVGAPLLDQTKVKEIFVSPTSPSTLYATSDRGVLQFVARSDVARAVEFYHPDFDHYFLTADSDEAAMLDVGTLPPWVPTGESWPVLDTATPSSLPVCRFFSAAFAPKSSHFYTPFADECAKVRTYPEWQFEGYAFFLELPDGYGTGTGHCQEGTLPLYRLYNNGMGGAPNHRYTTSRTTFNAMLSAGWLFEGEATTQVFACVPH
jgi:photosystem II stability/assembly factor-like uncharacterized protein